MQKKILLAAGALAGLFFATQAPEAQACHISENSLTLKYNTKGDSYCVGTDSDLEIRFIRKAGLNRGIVSARVNTKFEPGSCSFYLFTREGNRHYRFTIGAWQSLTTIARRDTYYGFRLGC